MNPSPDAPTTLGELRQRLQQPTDSSDLRKQFETLHSVGRELTLHEGFYAETVDAIVAWFRRKLKMSRPTVESLHVDRVVELYEQYGRTPATAERAEEPPTEDALNALLRVLSNGISDDRIRKASRILTDNTLTVNEKLTKIDALIPFPATASAEQLGKMLGVTKPAVLKSDWWIENRKGEKHSEIGRRQEGHRRRAKSYEAPSQHDDG
jgi:hypothetical protein